VHVNIVSLLTYLLNYMICVHGGDKFSKNVADEMARNPSCSGLHTRPVSRMHCMSVDRILSPLSKFGIYDNT